MLNQMSRIGLGCMGMSEFYGERDDKASLHALNAAFEIGYRHFDTADMYGMGHGEHLLGKFISQLGAASRNEVLIATKIGIRRDPNDRMSIRMDGSASYLREACDASLKRLGVEQIGLCYLHRRDPSTPIEESMLAMKDLMQAGKIAAVGLSEVSVQTLQDAAQITPITALQNEYSLWTRDPENEVFGVCAELGVKFVAYSPIGRGFLSGGMRAEMLDQSDLRSKLPRFQPGAFEANTKLVDTQRRISDELGVSPAQLALAWVLAQHPWIYPIPGTKNVKHLQDNFRSQHIRLQPEHLNALSRAFSPEAIIGERYPEALLKTVNV